MAPLKINQMFAFLAEDPDANGDEGIASMQTYLGHMPLVAADQARVDSLKKVAQKIANQTGVTVRCVKFSNREEIEVIKPKNA